VKSAAAHPAAKSHLSAAKTMKEEPVVPVSTSPQLARTGIVVLATIGVIIALQYLEALFIPIVLGILISYALEPIVATLTHYRIPRVLASGIVLLTLIGVGGVAVYQLSTQATAIVDKLPEAAQRLRRAFERNQPQTATAIQQVQSAANELDRAAKAATSPATPPGVARVQVEEPTFNVREYVMWGSVSLAAAAMQVMLILFLVFFLLASGDLYRRKIVKIAGPSLTQKKITVEILQDIDRQIESFLLVQAFTSTVVGLATWLAFTWLGLEQAAFWGLMAAIFNSIPYLGPVIVTGTTAVVGYLQFGDIGTASLVGLIALAITSVEGFLLTHWLSSRAARMNAVAIFVGLIFWGSIWQVWGMLLAVPMMMVLKAICDHVEDLTPVSELLGE